MGLDRYRDHAEGVVAKHADDVDHDSFDAERLTSDICQLVHLFVAHDMEWAALAVEQAFRGADKELVAIVVASIRERGR